MNALSVTNPVTATRRCAAPKCSRKLTGRADRATCSPKCRQRLSRRRRAGGKFARPGTGIHHVDDEWYTPPTIVEACRVALGAIDLDPASCEVAQREVKAARYFTADDDGLAQPWAGRVFLNPPYSVKTKRAFLARLAESYQAGAVTAAVAVLNVDLTPSWFEPLRPLYAAKATIRGRVNFYKAHPEDMRNPAFGSSIVYLGPERERFAAAFRDIADVDYPAVSVTDSVTARAA